MVSGKSGGGTENVHHITNNKYVWKILEWIKTYQSKDVILLPCHTCF